DVNIARLAEKSVKEFQPVATGKKIRLSLRKKGKLQGIRADGARISQVIDNLVRNAVKFTKPNGDVDVWAEKKGDEIVVAVRDTGIGMSEEEVGKLFKKFYQADSSVKRPAEGVGLGLFISKGLVEAHGGRIWVESKKGRGSTFYFSLPIG
ncbi:HAMP domain-containing histidine kinase, partial [Candidatus Micrarchaeota archaeon]|nr:HAMP domain-containing histidine kinase [Candidatus Micrarchaeota archaeon]